MRGPVANLTVARAEGTLLATRAEFGRSPTATEMAAFERRDLRRPRLKLCVLGDEESLLFLARVEQLEEGMILHMSYLEVLQ